MITNRGKKEQKKNTPFIRPTKIITQVKRTLYRGLPFTPNEVLESGLNFKKELALGIV